MVIAAKIVFENFILSTGGLKGIQGTCGVEGMRKDRRMNEKPTKGLLLAALPNVSNQPYSAERLPLTYATMLWIVSLQLRLQRNS